MDVAILCVVQRRSVTSLQVHMVSLVDRGMHSREELGMLGGLVIRCPRLPLMLSSGLFVRSGTVLEGRLAARSHCNEGSQYQTGELHDEDYPNNYAATEVKTART